MASGNTIDGLGPKVRAALSALTACDSQRQRLIDLCNFERAIPATKYKQEIVAHILGLKVNTLSNWRNDATGGANAGMLLDFVALLGFAPDKDTLAGLENAYDVEFQAPYPDHVFDLLDRWRGDSPAYLCWSAFCGVDDQVTGLGETPNSLYRGAPPAKFEALYKQHLPNLQLQLFDAVHWAVDNDGSPRVRSEYRRETHPTIFLTPGTAAPAVTYAAVDRRTAKTDKGKALPGLGPAALPYWLDGKAAPALFDHMLPAVGTSPAEIAAKAQLYGGKPALPLPIRDHVALGHAFTRGIVGTLCERIRASDRQCSSFTLKAGHGTGLSVALALLERNLSDKPETKVLSIIDDRERTKAALEALDDRKAAELSRWATSFDPPLKRLIVIIDDVSASTVKGRAQLNRFRNRCKVEFSAHPDTRLGFVFGSFGDVVTFSEDADLVLELTDADREDCYSRMTAEPAVIRGHIAGLPGIMREHAEARSFGNDAQAFIDHLLQHGRPQQAVIDHWLARIDDLTREQVSVVALTAAAQLVGQPIPERVIKRLIPPQDSAGDVDLEQMAEAGRLIVVGELGREDGAIALSCPRRAESILRRSGRYNPPYLVDAYSRLLRAALTDFYNRGDAALASMDFARHILQRLGKADLFLFDTKLQVSKQHVSGLVANGFLNALGSDPLIYYLADEGQQFEDKAKWAGTLAAHLSPIREHTASGQVLKPAFYYQESCAWFVGSLCDDCLAVIARRADAATPEIALSLLRAGRLLLFSKYHKREAQRLADDLDRAFSGDRVLTLLGTLLDEETKEPLRRANELIHCYAQFQGVRGWRARRGISSWIDKASLVLKDRGIPLDAGTWIERAWAAWRAADTEVERADALPEVSGFLQRARDSIEFDPIVQATWLKHLRRVQGRIEHQSAMGASDNDLGEE